MWDFGDFHQGAGAQVSHTYAAAGTYTAKVDRDGPGQQERHGDPHGRRDLAAGPRRERAAARAAARTALTSVSAPSLAAFRKRGVKVAATCGADGTAAAGLWAFKATARKLGLKYRGLGRATVACVAGKAVQVRLKPTTQVRRAIRVKRPRSLRITVALALQDGAPITRRVTIAR